MEQGPAQTLGSSRQERKSVRDQARMFVSCCHAVVTCIFWQQVPWALMFSIFHWNFGMIFHFVLQTLY